MTQLQNQQVIALESPYDVLLKRQMHTLRGELMPAHNNA